MQPTITETVSDTGTSLPIAPAAVNEADAARYINFSQEFLRQSRSHGAREGRTPGPPYVKVGRTVRYLITDLDAWLRQHRRTVK